MSSLYRNAVDQLQPALDAVNLQEIADQIRKARRLCGYAVGDSQYTLLAFLNRLKKIGIFGISATDVGDTFYITRGMTSEDLALFVSYSGEMKEINDELYTLRRRRVPIIALTGSIESYLAGMSTRTIVIPHLEGTTDEKVATFYSQFAFDYILNVIYALIYNGQQDSVQ